MKIPISMHRNLETGEDTMTYAEIDLERLEEFFFKAYAVEHPTPNRSCRDTDTAP